MRRKRSSGSCSASRFRLYRTTSGACSSRSHIFKYSLRQGTAASRLPGRVSPMDAQKRSEILCSMSEKNKSEFEKYYRGRETIVLAEEEIEKNGKKYLTGLNPEYVRFDVPADLGKVGDFIKICP